MEIVNWNKETRQAYVGTLLYSLFGILVSILSPFVFIGRVSRILSVSGPSTAGVMYSIFEVIVIVGYIVFFLAIKDLKNITEDEEKSAFGKIYLSIIFDIIGAFLGVFHLRIVSGILGILACIFLISAYSSLKESKNISSLSPKAASGFSLLFAAEILILVSICIGWIPFIKVVGSVLKAISWLLVLIGWKKVASPVQISGEESIKEKPVFDIVKEVLAESVDEAKYVATEAIEKSKIIAEELETKTKEAKENIKERLENKKEQ